MDDVKEWKQSMLGKIAETRDAVETLRRLAAGPLPDEVRAAGSGERPSYGPPAGGVLADRESTVAGMLREIDAKLDRILAAMDS